MEKIKKKFTTLLITFIILSIIPIILSAIPSSDSGMPKALGLILLIVSWIYWPIMITAFALTFYFFLKLKEIKGIKIFLIWFAAGIILFVYSYLIVFLGALITGPVDSGGLFLAIAGVVSSIINIIVIGIIAIVVYLQKGNKQIKQNGR